MSNPTSDWDLLRAYVDQRSEEAFAQLVSRHLDMVYAACRRQVRDAGMAEEATQATFVVLARKAGRLHSGVVLPAWLYRVARYTALNAVKMERRRRLHERKAATMVAECFQVDSSWHRLEPLLDEGVAGLGERDRVAIVMRYFQHRSLKEVGEALGTTEAAAGMRVNRALGKLREFFFRRGIALPAAALGGVLWSDSVRAAPAALHSTVCREALVAAQAGGGAGTVGVIAEQAMHAMGLARAGRAVLLCAGGVMAVVLAWYLVAAVLLRPPDPPRPSDNTHGDVEWTAHAGRPSAR